MLRNFIKTSAGTLGVLALAAFLAPTNSVIAESSAVTESLIKIDGSSTVYPITEAVSEEYQASPSSRPVTTSASAPFAEIIIIGVLAVAFSDLRSRQISSPLIPGSIKSKTTSAGFLVRAKFKPSSPEDTQCTSKDSFCRL